MRISYAITVCTEFLEIQRLINFLLKHKRAQDDIVVLFDEANGDKEIEAYLRSHPVNGEFMWHAGKFERHFANWKNKLTNHCTGDYIFQIDADEIPTKTLIEYLPDIIEGNPTVDVLLVPICIIFITYRNNCFVFLACRLFLDGIEQSTLHLGAWCMF